MIADSPSRFSHDSEKRMSSIAGQSLVVVGTVGLVTALVIACGSSDESAFVEDGGASSSGGFVGDGGFGSSDTSMPNVDLYANDPPPPWCGPGGDPAPPEPGGTEACPDDKNKPGCPCPALGAKAKCWTGLRKHRNLGICKDGEATCVQKNELNYVWSECAGQVLPATGATKGAQACTCFSAGQWKIANTSPCTAKSCTGGTCVVDSVSTFVDINGVAHCPSEIPPKAPPVQDWSTSTLKVDCAGHFKLCLRIRAGDFENPSAADCIIGEVCTEADYKVANVEQAWANLPGWLGKDQACSAKWFNTPGTVSPGYSEMIVKGQSVRCDAIDDGSGGDLVFNRVKYCPSMCSSNPSAPECVSCRRSSEGSF